MIWFIRFIVKHSTWSFAFTSNIILCSQILGSSSKHVGNSPLLQSRQPTQPLQAAASIPSPPSQQQQQEVIVVDTTSRSVVVHLICPICNRSVPHTELSSHFASCLQEVRTMWSCYTIAHKQSHLPRCRSGTKSSTAQDVFQTSSTMLGWPENGAYSLLHQMQSGGLRCRWPCPYTR